MRRKISRLGLLSLFELPFSLNCSAMAISGACVKEQAGWTDIERERERERDRRSEDIWILGDSLLNFFA